MDKITYRPLTGADGPDLEALIAESFHLARYVPDQRVLTQLKHAYLQSCLAEQTFCLAAEKNGALAGVIMCASNRHYRLLPHLPPLCAGLWSQFRMAAASLISGCSTKDFHNLHRIYRRLMAGRTRLYDGVLTLFAVNEACRGAGIGRELLRQAESYLLDHGVQRIYLYTDSTCNTAFYDRHGFCRADQRVMRTAAPGNAPLSVFLYEKSYAKEAPSCGSPSN